jgi:hypothetical protein
LGDFFGGEVFFCAKKVDDWLEAAAEPMLNERFNQPPLHLVALEL